MTTNTASDLIMNTAGLLSGDHDARLISLRAVGDILEHDRTARDVALLEASQDQGAREALAHLCAVLVHEHIARGQALAVLATIWLLEGDKPRAIELGRQSGERLGELSARMAEANYDGETVARLMGEAMSND